MPTAVAEGFAKNWSGEFQNQIATDYVAGIDEGALQRFQLRTLFLGRGGGRVGNGSLFILFPRSTFVDSLLS